MTPRPFYLCGPTASGKSTLALAIAREIGGEVVNADAFQLYRGIETLSAAPDATEQSQAPHHLYGILDPSETCDAQHYATLAQNAADEILARGKTPVITGGSGLYLKFLSHGSSPLPAGDPSLRAELDLLSLDQLVSRLIQLDPAEAARTNLQNRRYVTRAVEICTLSGRLASDLRDAWESATREKANSLRGIVILRERADLHQRIALRTESMLCGRAIEEVAALRNPSATCSMAIGLREIQQLLDGTIDLPQCRERINAATRQYAKRQESWFRRESWLQPMIWEMNADLPSAWRNALAVIDSPEAA